MIKNLKHIVYRCDDPGCIKCHCYDCTTVRAVSIRMIRPHEATVPVFTWLYPALGFGFQFRLLK